MAKTKIEGLNKFSQKLRKQLPEAIHEAVDPALEKGANEIANAARRFAPEDEGDLKESITVTKPGEMTPLHSSGGSQLAGPQQYIVSAGNSEVRYAPPVEFGSVHGDPQPFFWPAYRTEKKRVLGRIKRALKKAIEEEWKR